MGDELKGQRRCQYCGVPITRGAVVAGCPARASRLQTLVCQPVAAAVPRTKPISPDFERGFDRGIAAGRAEMAGEVRAMVEGWIRHHDKNAALARDVREPRHEDAHRACAHAMRTLLAQLEEQKP